MNSNSVPLHKHSKTIEYIYIYMNFKIASLIISVFNNFKTMYMLICVNTYTIQIHCKYYFVYTYF